MRGRAGGLTGHPQLAQRGATMKIDVLTLFPEVFWGRWM